MDLTLIPEPAMPPALDQAIRAGLCTCFPADAAVFSHSRAWHGSAPSFSAIAREGDLICAHVGVVERPLRAGATPLTIAGIQNVFVLPDHRGTGLSDRLLRLAMAEAARRPLDLGLLFCLPALEKVYSRCGWATLPPRPIFATNSAGTRYQLSDKNILMSHPLRRGELPEGEVDLCGDDW